MQLIIAFWCALTLHALRFFQWLAPLSFPCCYSFCCYYKPFTQAAHSFSPRPRGCFQVRRRLLLLHTLHQQLSSNDCSAYRLTSHCSGCPPPKWLFLPITNHLLVGRCLKHRSIVFHAGRRTEAVSVDFSFGGTSYSLSPPQRQVD